MHFLQDSQGWPGKSCPWLCGFGVTVNGASKRPPSMPDFAMGRANRRPIETALSNPDTPH
jgi:hypothetical protein